MGLSMAYAGSARADLMEAISPLILDSSNTIELQAVASIAIGLILYKHIIMALSAPFMSPVSEKRKPQCTTT